MLVQKMRGSFAGWNELNKKRYVKEMKDLIISRKCSAQTGRVQ
jgi:hypothetical protein